MPLHNSSEAIQTELLNKSLADGRDKASGFSKISPLKVASWAILIVAGLVQTWFMRHRVFSDGVSYLAIARNYVAGDWHSALNSYWSPLYSWLLALLMIVLRPSAYWEIGLMHFTNLLAYLAALVGFELFLGRLIRMQQRLIDGRGVSEQAVRIAGYSTFLISTLLLIGLGYNSPDMVALAIGLFLASILLKVEAGAARLHTYVLFGCLLGLEYLSRSAFAIFIPFYLIIAALLVWRRQKKSVLAPILYGGLAAFLVSAPFVIALSVSKGRFTIGDAGKLNYGWEVDGAARSIHWQGEPDNIGKPIHPTHKVLADPATYTFASPVPGSYPPWYEPSYWYAGIAPHLEWGSQLRVLRGSVRFLAVLCLCSAITIPVCVLVFLMGWRSWLSPHGILAYWFLLLPSVTYIAAFTLVYVDKRYVAGSLLLVWMCLLASVRVNDAALRAKANNVIQMLSIIFGLGCLAAKLGSPTLYALKDLAHVHESEQNLNWVIAEKLKQAGLQPGDHVACIGQAIDAEWASIDQVKIVAEIPVTWDREENLFRSISANRQEVEAFWRSGPETRAKVLDAFRKEGVTFVVADEIPSGCDRTGWTQLLQQDAPGLPRSSAAQYDTWKTAEYMRLTPVRSPATK